MRIIVYGTLSGKFPLEDWLKKLSGDVRAVILSRINRVRLGNFGDSKLIRGGGGVWELRVDVGPGYRVYYGKKGDAMVVLLVGGDKGSQIRDIAKAKQYWLEFKELVNE